MFVYMSLLENDVINETRSRSSHGHCQIEYTSAVLVSPKFIYKIYFGYTETANFCSI